MTWPSTPHWILFTTQEEKQTKQIDLVPFLIRIQTQPAFTPPNFHFSPAWNICIYIAPCVAKTAKAIPFLRTNTGAESWRDPHTFIFNGDRGVREGQDPCNSRVQGWGVNDTFGSMGLETFGGCPNARYFPPRCLVLLKAIIAHWCTILPSLHSVRDIYIMRICFYFIYITKERKDT